MHGNGTRTAWRLGVPASRAHRVLVRLGLNRLSWIDRPTGRVIRRLPTSRPGERLHFDPAGDDDRGPQVVQEVVAMLRCH